MSYNCIVNIFIIIMDNEYKANLWNECLKQNLFSDCRSEQLPKVQELFEESMEENQSVNEFISVLSVKIKQMNQLSYKDLIPSEKQPIIDFSDKIEEEPLKDIDKLIAEKQKERQNEEMNESPLSNTLSNPLSNTLSNPISNPLSNPLSNHEIKALNEENPTYKEIMDIKKKVQQQNLILEKILESQIKILKHIQKK